MVKININPGIERNIPQYLIFGMMLLIVLLAGCSNFLGSSYTREEIRATAFVIVAGRQTQDSEAQLGPTATGVIVIGRQTQDSEAQSLPTATRLPRQPTPRTTLTPGPQDCLPEEFSVWVDVTTADVETMEAELEILQSDDFTLDEINEIRTRVLEQESTLLTVDYPGCAARAQRRLREVYGLFALVLQAIIEEDAALIEIKNDAFIGEFLEFKRAFESVISRQGNQ